VTRKSEGGRVMKVKSIKMSMALTAFLALMLTPVGAMGQNDWDNPPIITSMAVETYTKATEALAAGRRQEARALFKEAEVQANRAYDLSYGLAKRGNQVGHALLDVTASVAVSAKKMTEVLKAKTKSK
jgi:hypothetical protein